jgi:glyoxylase-like metal-dependent hydrolase (beta-lactamase superfamily II)
MLHTFVIAALILTIVPSTVDAQDAKAIVAGASKAMGADNVTSVTYGGSATTGNFGQSKAIGGPLQITTVTNYSRAIDLTKPASRATGTTMPPRIPGGRPPQPGTLNQNITPANAGWTQQLEIWVTPWGFLKGAAANNATARAERGVNVVTWSPSQKAPSGQPYRVNGYINSQNLVERVETWVEHPILGDLHVEVSYSGYQDFGGLKVPTKIVQRRAGLTTFEGTITSASANPANIAELLTPPQGGGGRGGAGGGPGGAAGAKPTTEKPADGVYRMTGGGYVALVVEASDHIIVLEGGQNEARSVAIMAEAKQLIPNKPIKYVVNSHAHFDHAGGLAPFVAEGITIVTHQNNKAFYEKAFAAPRTLVGDNLAKTNRKPVIEGVGDRRTLGNTHPVELHYVKNLEHCDAMLVVHLPKERILFTADFTIPAQGQPVGPFVVTLVQNLEQLKLDFDEHIPVHTLNPPRRTDRTEMFSLVKAATQQ